MTQPLTRQLSTNEVQSDDGVITYASCRPGWALPAWTSWWKGGNVYAARLNSVVARSWHALTKETSVEMLVKTLAALALALIVGPGYIHTKEAYLRFDAAQKVKRQQAEAAAEAQRLEAAEAQKREANQALIAAFSNNLKSAIANPALAATPADNAFNEAGLDSWAEIFAAVEGGRAPDFTQQASSTQPWSKTVQSVFLGPNRYLLSAIIDDAGIRKVWVGHFFDGSGRGTITSTSSVKTITNIPGMTPSEIYVPRNFGVVDFERINATFLSAYK